MKVQLELVKVKLELLKVQIEQANLTKFEIQRFYQNEPKFNGIFSRNYVTKIKNGAYAINLDEYKSVGTHWIALNVNGDNTTYFDSF